MDKLEITYKIYLEAEDISGSRIQSCIANVRNLLTGHRSVYLKNASIEDESEIEEFVLRLYIEHEVYEQPCTSNEDAQNFVLDLAEFLDTVAAANSYMDLEGSFSWSYGGEKKSYTFHSESGMDYCDLVEAE